MFQLRLGGLSLARSWSYHPLPMPQRRRPRGWRKRGVLKTDDLLHSEVRSHTVAVLVDARHSASLAFAGFAEGDRTYSPHLGVEVSGVLGQVGVSQALPISAGEPSWGRRNIRISSEETVAFAPAQRLECVREDVTGRKARVAGLNRMAP